ncbi:hypothetical protein RIF25_09690 [Thermosynechococcaceae cyanobacterium BACA0444]|uniref:tRNA nuclease CdiA C-terminal domain-containing protein n=1 Tax=Pseudocalidococcus azoricus BACA0444 TaxID=2918990 RepID=A0AAE4FS21_9CYAN|nr:hypothetical protein [Pseudocalidococcus azoricus]MDS3861076.1 hypothetical protein [Pseudocalidococcus azoricus BACA0444]
MAEVQSQLSKTAVNPIAQNRIAYKAAGPEYERHYFDEQTGGYVLIHEGHNRSDDFASELFISEVFAKQGQVVELVDESRKEQYVRRFDALVDGENWEFKVLTTKAKNVRGAFQQGLIKGRSQAPRIAYYINRDAAIRDLNFGLKQAIYIDREDQKIQRVALVFRDGSINQRSRGEIDAGQYF